MFDTEGLWSSVIIFVLSLGAIYILLDRVIFKFIKLKNKDKTMKVFLNVFLGLGIAFLFYRIYLCYPEIGGEYLLYQNLFGSIVQVCVLALATTGIVLIFKTSTTTNFAQGMIATVGAFMAAIVSSWLVSEYSEISNFMMVFIAMIVGALTSFTLGICIDVFIIRKAKYPTPVGKQMITMGLVLVITGLIPVVFGTLPLAVNKLSYDVFTVFTLDINGMNMDVTMTMHALYTVIITVVLLVLLFSLLRFTKWGLGVRATASNEMVASMMGVNTKVITAMSWAIAGLLGGVAAVLLAPTSNTLQVTMMIPTQVNGFLAAILGSFSSFVGPIIASIFIPVITKMMSLVASPWSEAIVYIIILVIVLVKPSGLFGKQIAKKV